MKQKQHMLKHASSLIFKCKEGSDYLVCLDYPVMTERIRLHTFAGKRLVRVFCGRIFIHRSNLILFRSYYKFEYFLNQNKFVNDLEYQI